MLFSSRIKARQRQRALARAIVGLENRVLLAYTLEPHFTGDGIMEGVGSNIVAVQSDNKILAGDENGSVLRRFNVDGSDDATFGGSGRITNPFPIRDVLLSGNKIIVTSGNPACYNFCAGNTYPQLYDPLGRYLFAGVTFNR